MGWPLGTIRAKDEPEPERKKSQAAYTKIPPKARPLPKLYGLAQDVEIYTPQGIVDAKAGDLLFCHGDELWVLAPEHVPLEWSLKVQEPSQ